MLLGDARTLWIQNMSPVAVFVCVHGTNSVCETKQEQRDKCKRVPCQASNCLLNWPLRRTSWRNYCYWQRFTQKCSSICTSLHNPREQLQPRALFSDDTQNPSSREDDFLVLIYMKRENTKKLPYQLRYSKTVLINALYLFQICWKNIINEAWMNINPII